MILIILLDLEREKPADGRHCKKQQQIAHALSLIHIYSGCSRDTVDVMKAAKKSGAVTIVLTNFKDSLISRYADLLLCTSQEQLFYGDAIFSRTTQLLLVDMIYMGLLASDYNRYAGRLDKSSRVIRDKAYE